MDANTIQSGASAAFNLANYEAADTGLLEVLNQRKVPLLGNDGQPVTIELYGPGSEQYVKVQAEIDSASQARVFANMRGGKAAKDSADQARADRIRKLSACTKAISPNFPLSPDALYKNSKLGYITNQVAEYLEDWANFPAACAAS